MAEITIGAEAIDRGSHNAATYTSVSTGYPANASGNITAIEVWLNTNATAFKVGTFYGSTTSLTRRDSAVIGAVTAGSKQKFTGLNIDVKKGDFIGCYGGDIDAIGSYNLGMSYSFGDKFTGTNAFTYSSSGAISLYGTGTTVSAGGGILIGSILNSDILRGRILRG